MGHTCVLVLDSLKNALENVLCLMKFTDVGSACGLTSPSVICSNDLNLGHNGLMHHIMNRLSSGKSHSSRCRMCDQSVFFSYFLHSAFTLIDAIYLLEL